mmetsp:Transcript_12836/g.34107  ORF Transcript_12836/g.34107 Transcript_12836/m.34107 type:complete len:646 (-) Transcript_12836:117-2054(-)
MKGGVMILVCLKSLLRGNWFWHPRGARALGKVEQRSREWDSSSSSSSTVTAAPPGGPVLELEDWPGASQQPTSAYSDMHGQGSRASTETRRDEGGLFSPSPPPEAPAARSAQPQQLQPYSLSLASGNLAHLQQQQQLQQASVMLPMPAQASTPRPPMRSPRPVVSPIPEARSCPLPGVAAPAAAAAAAGETDPAPGSSSDAIPHSHLLLLRPTARSSPHQRSTSRSPNPPLSSSLSISPSMTTRASTTTPSLKPPPLRPSLPPSTNPAWSRQSRAQHSTQPGVLRTPEAELAHVSTLSHPLYPSAAASQTVASGPSLLPLRNAAQPPTSSHPASAVGEVRSGGLPSVGQPAPLPRPTSAFTGLFQGPAASATWVLPSTPPLASSSWDLPLWSVPAHKVSARGSLTQAGQLSGPALDPNGSDSPAQPDPPMSSTGWGPATRPQVLITLLGSCALFRTMPPSGVLESFARSLGARLHTCNAADLSSALAALARLRFLPDERWMLRFFAAARMRMPQFSASQLVALLHGLARLRVRPDHAWMEWALAEVGQKMCSCKPSDFARLAWALSTLGYRPSAPWLESFCGASQLCLGHYSAHELWMLSCSLAKLGVRASSGSGSGSSSSSSSSSSCHSFHRYSFSSSSSYRPL